MIVMDIISASQISRLDYNFHECFKGKMCGIHFEPFKKGQEYKKTANNLNLIFIVLFLITFKLSNLT